ncbi:hypothetical protein PNEG_00287 [Pneumocystis murina B123]|uniref:Exocyst complex component EXO84 n=1 Tax=Pneumocystis murina (strain B123) TaxID=1069680 RepID=M7NVW1_PNEMU|nr:hypothetical protein PNEG_00287 [Pneumocystis murina B123]EMR11256.1 hypothetical protein PNEG_00287 [Pneumocystis murina B123]
MEDRLQIKGQALKKEKMDELLEDTFPPLPKVREKDKIRVGSLIKRRYSGRVGPTILNRDGDNVDGFSGSLRGTGKYGNDYQQPSHEFSLSNFTSQNFSAEEYVNNNFQNATEDEISKFYNQLVQSYETISSDLQQNIFDNYLKFVSISKEISNMSSDMSTIRDHLNSLCDAIELLKDDINSLSQDSLSLEKNKWKSYKNSISDLRNIWEDQIKDLLENVEGAQKFLPTAYGRHIVYESSDWKELKCTSWKPKSKTRLILLNDNLLIVRISPKYQISQNSAQKTGKVKYIAENCFPLTEIQIIDLEPNEAYLKERNITGTIIIQKEKQNFIFKTDKIEEKNKLLQAFEKEYHTLTKIQRGEIEAMRKARESIYFLNTKDSSITAQTLLNRLYLNNSETISPNNGEIKDFQWVQDKIEELDIMIAHRLLEDATKSIEKDIRITVENLKESITTELIILKLENRSSKLADIICDELDKMSSYKNIVKKNVHYLLRLGYENRAKKSFLASRSNLIKRRTRQLYFKENIVSYISDLALIHFVLIHNTAEMYISAFQKPSLTSSLITWIKSQIENFLELFSKQICFISFNSDIYSNSMKIIKEQCKILNNLGIDMSFLFKNFEDNFKKKTESPNS